MTWGFPGSVAESGLRLGDIRAISRNIRHFRILRGLAPMPTGPGPNAYSVVAYNDKAALALLKTFSSIGVSVPGDVLLSGFDDIPAAATSNSPLTTMAQPVDEIASVAFHTLASRIKSPQLPPRKTLLRCRLVPRASSDSLAGVVRGRHARRLVT